MEIETITAPPTSDTGGSGDATPEVKAKPDSSGAPESETKAERKLRLKFGKNEREVSEAEAVMLAQKGWASDEKFKAAKALEREVKDAIEKGDFDFLIQKKYGKNKIEWAKEELKKELKRRTASPEELEISEREERLSKLRAEEEELTAKRKEEKLEAATKRYQEQYDREFAAAIQKHKIPTKNKYVMSRAVKIAQEIVAEDLEPDWDLVVGEAKRQWQEELSDTVDAEEDFTWLGDRAKKISKWLVSGGVSKKAADAQALKIVKQEDAEKDVSTPVDADEYWEKKRKEWSK